MNCEIELIFSKNRVEKFFMMLFHDKKDIDFYTNSSFFIDLNIDLDDNFCDITFSDCLFITINFNNNTFSSEYDNYYVDYDNYENDGEIISIVDENILVPPHHLINFFKNCIFEDKLLYEIMSFKNLNLHSHLTNNPIHKKIFFKELLNQMY